MSSPDLTALAAGVLRLQAPPERILVVDCGDGDCVLFLAREFPTARVRGVDHSAEAIHDASTRVGLDPEGRVAFKRGRLRALPYPDDQFDLVALGGGRNHPRELARVLRSGGSLLTVGLPSWPRRRFGRHGFTLVDSGAAVGVPFHLARLDGER